jgi:SAM-dependent methyltransferase
METQKKIFLGGEADRWFQRNASALGNPDDAAFRALSRLKPESVLEVGCANGWRLALAKEQWGAKCAGVDPSQAAIADGSVRFPGIPLHVGTADDLPFILDTFDCVVLGFFLYLCDRADLFRIAAETDRVLNPGGYLIVYDFCPPAPYRNPYSHRAGVFSHKMDHSRMWSWHPAYALWSHEVTAHPGADPVDPNERLAVTILRKG